MDIEALIRDLELYLRRPLTPEEKRLLRLTEPRQANTGVTVMDLPRLTRPPKAEAS
ncbi:MAG: hypothetical protein ACR2IF_13220 [Terriglobales bacterium]